MRFRLLMIMAVFCTVMTVAGQDADAEGSRNRLFGSLRVHTARTFASWGLGLRSYSRSRVMPFYTDDLGSGSPWGQMPMIGPGMPRIYTDDLESGNDYGQILLLGPDTPRIYTDDLGSGSDYGAIIVLGAGVHGTEF